MGPFSAGASLFFSPRVLAASRPFKRARWRSICTTLAIVLERDEQAFEARRIIVRPNEDKGPLTNLIINLFARPAGTLA